MRAQFAALRWDGGRVLRCLLRCLRSGNPTVRESACAALAVVAEHNRDTALALVEMGAVEFLSATLRPKAVDAAIAAAGAAELPGFVIAASCALREICRSHAPAKDRARRMGCIAALDVAISKCPELWPPLGLDPGSAATLEFAAARASAVWNSCVQLAVMDRETIVHAMWAAIDSCAESSEVRQRVAVASVALTPR
jgi:hypothetical protein